MKISRLITLIVLFGLIPWASACRPLATATPDAVEATQPIITQQMTPNQSVPTVEVSATDITEAFQTAVAASVAQTLRAAMPTPVNTSIATATSAIAATLLPTPGSTVPGIEATPLLPFNVPAIGTLEVKTMEGCAGSDGISFNTAGGQYADRGFPGVGKTLTTGTYTVTLTAGFGEALTREDIVVQEGQTTIVDFSQELGKLQIQGYPQLGGPLYAVGVGSYNRYTPGYGDPCGLPGVYTVTFPEQSCSPGYGLTYNCTTIGLYLSANGLVFDVEVKAGEITAVDPEEWPYQLGRLVFNPGTKLGQAQIEDMQTHSLFTYTLNNNYGYWMLPGTYKITLTGQPYTGTFYESVEIKAGEETILQPPTLTTPAP